MARGDKGVNGLDEFCKEHDIAYSEHKDSKERYKADQKLAKGAISRLFSKDASFGERAASLFVTTAMKTKTGLSKFGLGIAKSKQRKNMKKSKKTKKRTCAKKIAFATLVKDARDGVKKAKAKTLGTAIMAALRSVKRSRKGKIVKMPRTIKVPNISGGILPVGILAALAAAGPVVSSVAGVIKTIKDIRNAKQQLMENIRHNKAMEMKLGNGLYLGVGKRGRGLYLRPQRYVGGNMSFGKQSKNSH